MQPILRSSKRLLLQSRILYAIALLFPLSCIGQYYITGKITDDRKNPLPQVAIKLFSNNGLYRNGNTGEFGIPSSRRNDTLLCILKGYDTLRAPVLAGTFNNLVLKPTPTTREERKSRLSSLTKNLIQDPVYVRHIYDETYSKNLENEFVNASKFPSTGFSLNVNKASYSNVRRFIKSNTIMPTDAVRIEEMLNYFTLSCTPFPTGKNIFNVETRLSGCPWNDESLLLFINVQAKKMDLDKVPHSNLVFLIDDSGSMEMAGRLPLLKSGFKMLVNNLRATDTVTLVTYGGSAGVILEATAGTEKDKILAAIEGLSAAGATPGSSGLKLAYQMAQKSFIPHGNNRVILATDGDFNVGPTNEKELENLIVGYRNSGIFLTCLGVGMGNYKDSKLETLARFGNGNFSYLDNEREAEKVLVKEFTQTVVSVASDVFLNLDFDPKWVDEYRLIGFDNKLEALSDSSSALEGGEIGSGHSLIAMFEVKPRGQTTTDLLNNAGTIIGEMKLQYKLPNQSKQESLSKTVPLNYVAFSGLDRQLRFATSVAMYGQLIKFSQYAKTYGFDNVAAIATEAASPLDLLQQEFVTLIQTTKKIYLQQGKGKKKKGS